MRIENRMQLQLWREECKEKAAERKLLYSGLWRNRMSGRWFR